MTPAKTAAPRPASDTNAMPNTVTGAADALLRAAVEACRQHERVGRLLDRAEVEDEVQEAAALCDLAYHHLVARTARYETTATDGRGDLDDPLWHAANALWHASREYARRHHSCNSQSAKFGKHSSEKFGALQLEYELEASSLLALRQTVAAYRKLRPEAE